MLKPEMALKLLRFAVVGGLVTLVFMALNWAFGREFSRQASFLLAYPPAMGVHFLLNKYWTFAHFRQNSRRQIGEYLLMAFGCFLIQWAFFNGISAWTPLPGWMSAGLASAAQMAVSFLIMQRRVFAHSAAT